MTSCELVADHVDLTAEDDALLRLCDARKIVVLDRLDEGKSSASVFVANVEFNSRPLQPHSGPNFIKIDRSLLIQEEIERHMRARRGIEEFCPELIHWFGDEKAQRKAVILAPAARSTLHIKTFARLLTEGELAPDKLSRVNEQLCANILNVWNPPGPHLGNSSHTPYDWLIETLDRGTYHKGRLDEVLHLPIGGLDNPQFFTSQGIRGLLPNPVAYVRHPELWQTRHQLLGPVGRLHGDLHGGNLVCHQKDVTQTPWIIDLARSEDNPDSLLFYDLAHLELDILIRRLDSQDWKCWNDVLTKISAEIVPKDRPADPAFGTWIIVEPLRRQVDQLIQSAPANATDHYQAVWWLAACAVGLVYARRESYKGKREQVISYLYAAFMLDRAFKELQWDVENASDPFRLDLNTFTSVSLPPREVEVEYANALHAAFGKFEKMYVDLDGVVDDLTRDDETTDSAEFRPKIRKWSDFNQAFTEKGQDTKGGIRKPRTIQGARAAVRQFDRIILLGGPGAGKSLTLRRLALDYAIDLEHRTDARIPVFISLASYQPPMPFNQFVQQEIARYSPRLAPYSDSLLTTNRIIFLCDALNEMRRGVDDQAIQEFRRFIKDKRYLVISCRRDEFNPPDLADAGRFRFISLRALTPHQIQHVIQKYHFIGSSVTPALNSDQQKMLWEKELKGSDLLLQAWDTFAEAGKTDEFWSRGVEISMPKEQKLARQTVLQDGKGVMQISQNPYLLTVIIELFASKNVLPDTRDMLFFEFIGALLATKIIDNPAYAGWSKPDALQLINGLAKLALEMEIDPNEQRGGTVTELPEQDASACIGGERFLNAGIDCEILQQQDHTIRFAHQMLQQFLPLYPAIVAYKANETDGLLQQVQSLALDGFLDMRGSTPILKTMLDKAIQLVDEKGEDRNLLQKLLGKRGNLYVDERQYALAGNDYLRAAEVTAKLENPKREIRLLTLAGSAQSELPDLDPTIALAKAENLILDHNLKGTESEAQLEGARGYVALVRENYEVAAASYQRQLDLRGTLQHREAWFHPLNNLSIALGKQGGTHLEEARAKANQALEIAKTLNSFSLISRISETLGNLLAQSGDPSAAKKLLCEALWQATLIENREIVEKMRKTLAIHALECD